MPKKKNLNQVKYVSMADFYQNIEDYKTLDGKLDFATRYILNHDMGATQDYAFSGVVNLARQKIAEIIKRNPKDATNMRARMFLGNPAGYIKGEADKLAKQIDESEVNFLDEEKLKENCENISKVMNEEFNAEVFEVDKLSRSIGVRSRVEAGFGGKKQLEDNLKAANSHKWYAIFSSSSRQWKGLEEAYESFNNPNNEDFGDYDKLNNASISYLQHKFPKWEPRLPLPENAFSKLNESETAKVNFALNVMKSLKEQYNVDDTFHNLVDANKDADIKYEDLPEKAENVIDLEQLAFQNKLKEDVDIENDPIVKQMDKDMNIGVVNEKDDPYIKLPEVE